MQLNYADLLKMVIYQYQEEPKMKKYLILLLLTVVMLSSCNDDDDYSLDKFWVSIATVENPNNEPFFFLKLDNGETLWTAATNYYNYKPQSGQRIIADYTILNDKPTGSNYQHDVKLNDAYNILTKRIFHITPEEQDSIGNDPIGINDMWIGSNYLNIKFYYSGYNRIHFINLVKDDSKEYADNKIHLEFRHNANNDKEQYKQAGIVSFDLRTIFVQPREITERVNLVIHVKGFDGKETIHEYIYDPNNTGITPREFSREEYDETKGADVG